MGRLTFKKRFEHYNPDKETIVICVDDYTQIVESEETQFGEFLHYYLEGKAVDKLAGYEELKERGLIKTVVHGRWIEKPYLLGTTRYCSICGENYGMPHGIFNYCPNCGCKMDKEKE